MGAWDLGKGGVRTSIIVWTGDFEGVIFRNVGDGESRESVFLRSTLYRKVRQVASEGALISVKCPWV